MEVRLWSCSTGKLKMMLKLIKKEEKRKVFEIIGNGNIMFFPNSLEKGEKIGF